MRLATPSAETLRAQARRGAWITREAMLTLGAVFGGICIAAAAAAALLGVRPLIVESGSMSPSIGAGAVALARPVDSADLMVGDIVSVRAPTGSRVMHRVAAIARDGGDTELTLRGDANEEPDDETYLVGSGDTAEKVFFSVPELGYAVVWLSTPAGLLLVGALGSVALFSLWRPGTGASRGPVVGLAALTVAVAGCGGLATRGTTAYFSDTATLASGAIESGDLEPPASASCLADQLEATVSWPADPRYDYEVVLRRVSDKTIVSTRQVTGSDDGATYTGLGDFGLVAGDGTVEFQVEVTSTLANAPSWASSTARSYDTIRVLALTVGATATCTT
jgi:signal peptidase I